MKRLQTQNQLQDLLDNELGWRIKEIADMKSAVKKSTFISERTLIRAAIPLLYAHWEGFVKVAATGYLTYISNQGLNYLELKSCFSIFGLKKELNELANSQSSLVNIAAIEFVRDQLGTKANLKIDSAINTQSNLSSTVFKNILLSVGINPDGYEIRCNLIDESLLRRRNHIAHGEYLDVKSNEWAILADEILLLLRQVKTDIENSIATTSYKRP